MKTVQIKNISLKNYKGKGTWDFQADFGKITKISGVNRSGKSSVLDGYMDVLTGKLADGSQPDSVRPHDENGKDLNRSEIVRELVLDIDGKETTVTKTTAQKWRKPRGTSEEIFDGNKTTYAIDGFESSNQKDYQNFIEGIAPADTLLMCSNAQPFLSLVRKSTAEARKLLETLAGFSIEKFISENPQYVNIAEIAKGHSIEDTLKKLRKDLAAQKKEMEKVRGNLEYEQTRDVSGNIEVSDLELAINSIKEQIAELDKQEAALDTAVKAYDEASQGILELKFEQSEIVRKANEGIVRARSEAETDIFNLQEEKKKAQRDKHSAEWDLDKASRNFTDAQQRLKNAQDDYRAMLAETFDESTLEAIKAEEFDENTLICPTCKQELPKERQEALKADWEKSKAERIIAQESSRTVWGKTKAAIIRRITEDGNKAQSDKKKAKADKADAEKRLTESNEEIAGLEKQITAKESELYELPTEADLSQNTEYQRITAQIAEKEAAMENMSSGAEKRAEIKSGRDRLMSEKSTYEAKILKAQADVEEKEKRIEGLEKEVKNQAQKMADIERQIDELTNFSIEKNQQLAAEVNMHFSHFHFEFLTFTIEGNPQETLKLVCNSCGTSYFDGLNGGDKRLVELDLCRGLQKIQDLSLPIWLDEASVIDDWRIPKTEQQLIILQRSDEPKLKVEILED